MLRLMLAAALLAAATGVGCLQDLTGAPSPAAEAVREAVDGRVLETRTRIRLYQAPLRLPGLWFLWSPAVPQRTALAEGQHVLVTRVGDAGAWDRRALWLQVTGHGARGWIRLGPSSAAAARLWTLFRDAPSGDATSDHRPPERTTAK